MRGKTLWVNKKNGKIYTFLYEARHSETQERMAIYLGSNGDIWARPLELFYEKFEMYKQ